MGGMGGGTIPAMNAAMAEWSGGGYRNGYCAGNAADAGVCPAARAARAAAMTGLGGALGCDVATRGCVLGTECGCRLFEAGEQEEAAAAAAAAVNAGGGVGRTQIGC